MSRKTNYTIRQLEAALITLREKILAGMSPTAATEGLIAELMASKQHVLANVLRGKTGELVFVGEFLASLTHIKSLDALDKEEQGLNFATKLMFLRSWIKGKEFDLFPPLLTAVCCLCHNEDGTRFLDELRASGKAVREDLSRG